MKTSYIYLGFLFIILFTSCKKEQDLNIEMKMIETGNLTVQVVNNAGTAIPEARIKIYYEGSSIELFDEFSDEKGQFNFGKVYSGTYVIQIEDVEIGGVKYYPAKVVQVVNGEDKTVKINAEEYIGTIEFTVSTYLDYPDYIDTVVAGVTVALIPLEDYESGLEFDELLDIAILSQTTNSLGKAVFSNAPSDVQYFIMVYIDSENYQLIYNYYSVDKKDTEEYDVNVDDNIFGVLFE